VAGIYFHIPFCKQTCIYCDFHFKAGKHNSLPMTQAMGKELVYRKEEVSNKEITTLYFGGGTPSLLSIEEIGRLLNLVYSHFSVASNAEITLEANPDDMSLQKLQQLWTLGVNRLSIGVQSFNNDVLHWMNRSHNSEEAIVAIDRAHQVGFKDLSLDIITGVPNAPKNQHLIDVEKALTLGINHLSAYSLTLEKNTVWDRLLHKKQAAAPNESEQLTAFEEAGALLSEKGWLHYEISNFALNVDHISKHNSAYWEGTPYLGVGPSAHSFDGNYRRWNLTNHHHYIAAGEQGCDVPHEKELINAEMRFNELLMTGLRTLKGVSICALHDLLPNETNTLLNTITHKKEQVFLENGFLKLQPNARRFADGIASSFFVVS